MGEKRTLQAQVADPQLFEEGKRYLKIALFKEDGTPYSPGGGEVGPQGAQGVAGPEGPAGPQGPPGAAGAAGAAGAQGPLGPAGANGTGFRWRGNYNPATAYAVDDVVAYLGSSFIAVLPTTGVTPNDASPNWDLIAIAGPPGPQGPAGTNGAAGAAGAAGSAGAQGPQGPAGSAGPAGSVGPAGAQGPKGDPGADGSGAPAIRFTAKRTADAPLGAGYIGPLTTPEVEDSHGFYNGQKFQPTEPGWYRLSAKLIFDSSAGNPIEAYIVKNFSTPNTTPGPNIVDSDLAVTRSDGWGSLTLDTMVYFNGTSDYVVLYCWLGGTGGTIRGTSNQPTHFEGHSISAAGPVGPAGPPGGLFRGPWVANPTQPYVKGELVLHAGRVWVAPNVIAQSVAPDVNPSAPVNKTLSPVEGGISRNFPAIRAWDGNPWTVAGTGGPYGDPRYVDINPGGSITIQKLSGSGGNDFVKLYDSNGAQVGAEATALPFTWSGLPAGRYFVAFYNADGYVNQLVLGGGAVKTSPEPWTPSTILSAVADEGTVLAKRTKLNFAGAGVTATDDPNNDATLVTIPGGGGGGSSWVYDSEVAEVGSVTIPGLDGDVDIEYEVIVDGEVAAGAAARNITVRPNGAAVGTHFAYVSGGIDPSGPGVGLDIGILIGYTPTGNSRILARGLLSAKSGRKRMYTGTYHHGGQTSGNDGNVGTFGGRWDDTTTNLDSLIVHFGGALFNGRVRVKKV